MTNLTTEGSELRHRIDAQIAADDAQAARGSLCELWRAASAASTAAFVVSRFEQLRTRLHLREYRLAILRSFTVEPMVPLLRAAAWVAGIDLTVRLSDFNTYVQDIVDPGSQLYAGNPDAVILAVQTRDVAPELWGEFVALTPEQARAAVGRIAEEFRTWIGTFRRHSRAHLIVHNLEQPELPARGAMDAQGGGADGQAQAVQDVNRALRSVSAEFTGVYVLDYDALVARHGRTAWHDERKWLTVRLPISGRHLNDMVREWLRFLHPLTGAVAKVLAVDLDNTLWGGIIGEDGLAGIQLGGEYPGAAYQAVQRALLDLHGRGILLAICSKNNRDDAMEAIENHPGMLLKPGHFAALRINWADKAENLREIAEELKVGIDAIALLDDNPIERQQVRAQVPEVFVIDLPAEPMEFSRALRDCPIFERLAITTEDRQRAEMYQVQRERDRLEQSVLSREDFYRSLRQEVEIHPVTPGSLARIAQLTNKTNQFNLTTRRYTEQQISEMVDSGGYECFSIRVRDRFGDNGLVGVAITRQEGPACEIDSFLLSCRVIGRTIESAFLAFLAGRARRRGAGQLRGWFLRTAKNLPARTFYADHGFTLVETDGDGTLWSLELAGNAAPWPEWVRLHQVDGDETR